MSPPVDSVIPSPTCPSATDVVVIGGGIVGVSTALMLARQGVRVVLAEKGRIGGEQSSRNWGWCRAMGRDFREIPLILESLRLWDQMAGLTGQDVGFRRCGIAYLCDREEDLGKYDRFLAHAEKWQIGSKIIGRAEVEQRLPGLTRSYAGALYTENDGRAEPAVAAPAIARAVMAAGGTVLTDCAVRTVETSGGRISGVITERGPIACSQVVLAGGVWSRLFAGNLGLDLPQLPVLGSVLRTAPLAGGPDLSVAASDYAFRRRADGGYSIAHGGLSTAEITPDHFRQFRRYLPALRGEWRSLRLRFGARFFEGLATRRHWRADQVTPFEQTRIFDPAPDHRLLDAALQALRAAHPDLAGVREVERWGGMIDVTPDAVPVISPVEQTPGLFIGTGFSGHGFGLGPGAGRLLADLVTGRPPVVDPAPFRFSRFHDGTPITLDGGF